MEIYFDSFFLQLGLKLLRAVLTLIMCDDHTSHIQPPCQKFVPQTQDIHVIGNPQIPMYLVFLYIRCAYNDDDLRVAG